MKLLPSPRPRPAARPVKLTLEPVEDRCNPDGSFGPWGTPVNLGPVVNTAASDQHPAISPDGLSLYITSNRAGSVPGADGKLSLDLWVSQRALKNDPWGTPFNLGDTINGPGRDFSPAFSPDGHWMIYARSPDANENNDDLYITHRGDKHDDRGWETPINLGPDINIPGFGDSGPALFEDSETGLLNLYFTSNRPGGLGDWDIYRSVRQEDGTWAPAELVREVSTPNRDVRNTIRGDGLEMILTATNPAHLPFPPNSPQAALDLYVSTRPTTRDPWSTPANLGVTVNSPGSTVADSAPYLSRDGKSLYFYSNRPGGFVGNDLYVTTRTELDEGEEPAERYGRSRAFIAAFAAAEVPAVTTPEPSAPARQGLAPPAEQLPDEPEAATALTPVVEVALHVPSPAAPGDPTDMEFDLLGVGVVIG